MRNLRSFAALRMTTVVTLLLFALAHCASGIADPSQPPATASVELISISPAAGSTLDERSELVAEIQYSIANFKPSTDYYLAPLFAENGGAGKTFNKLDRIDQSTHLTSPSGIATIRYGVARELRSDKLARPVLVFFFLMERTGAHATRVIGSVGPFQYSAAK
jgi:hypothetical protein